MFLGGINGTSAAPTAVPDASIRAAREGRHGRAEKRAEQGMKSVRQEHFFLYKGGSWQFQDKKKKKRQLRRNSLYAAPTK